MMYSLGALSIIDIDNRARGRLEGGFTDIPNDSHDGKQARIAVHIAEFDGLAESILIWPPCTGQRLADHRHVLSIRPVALFKDAPAQQGNAKGREKVCRNNAEV